MKSPPSFSNCLVVAGIAVCSLLPAGASAASNGAIDAKKTACIYAHRIDHTRVVDKNTILFYMIGGDIWKNTLATPCTTLTTQEGFAFEPKVDRLCSNLEHIHVLRTGQVCLLGEFTPYTPPAPSSGK